MGFRACGSPPVRDLPLVSCFPRLLKEELSLERPLFMLSLFLGRSSGRPSLKNRKLWLDFLLRLLGSIPASASVMDFSTWPTWVPSPPCAPIDQVFSAVMLGRASLQDLYSARTPSLGGLLDIESEEVGWKGDTSWIMPVSPAFMEYRPVGWSCILFSFSVRSKDVPLPFVLLKSCRWFVRSSLTLLMSCRLNWLEGEEDGRPTLSVARKSLADNEAIIAILLAGGCALSVVLMPLLPCSSLEERSDCGPNGS